ncbi:MAG: hypothetical protein JXR07_02830 [Reichenbachiella sp.]
MNVKFRTGMAKCTEYLEMIQNVVDNESSRKEEVYLRRHLKMCLKCLDKLNLDVELKKALQHKLKNQPVPAGLADSIRKKISSSA